VSLQGTLPPRFSALGELLEKQLAEGRHLGVAVCVYERGEPVVDCWGGRVSEGGAPWQRDTRATVFSTTKGVTASCLHLCVERGLLSVDDPVTKIWPDFARRGGARGKERVTVRQLLSHTAAIPQCPDAVTRFEQTADWDFMVSQMEELEPEWEPGQGSGYHAVNFGWLVGEVVRRVSGRSLGTFLREEIAEPLGLDGVHVGLPEALEPTVAPLEAPPAGHGLGANAPPDLTRPDSLMARTLLRPKGDLVAYMNTRPARAAELPASGGIATARGLARLYACLAEGGRLDGVRLWSPATLARATELQVPEGQKDFVIGFPMRWALGFHLGGPFTPCGPNPRSFGHAGYGGSVAFADPDARLGVGIVLNRMQNELQGGFRVMLAVKAIYDSLAGS
jgi:CubicO group peptidase (beta-lactamase class C family)